MFNESIGEKKIILNSHVSKTHLQQLARIVTSTTHCISFPTTIDFWKLALHSISVYP